MSVCDVTVSSLRPAPESIRQGAARLWKSQGMTTIGITGSTGQLGRLIIDRLTADPIPGASLRLIVRDASRAPALTDATGEPAEVRVAEYGDAAASRAALEGVDTLFMASGSESPTRRDEHRTF